MRVIINRSDAIGDTLLTMPMAKVIKENHPEAKVCFIISPRSEDLFPDHPYVDEYWVLDHSNSTFSKLNFLNKKMKNFNATHFFHVGGSHIPSIAAFINKVPFRGGLRSKWSSFLFLNQALRQKRSMVTMHESEYNISLLSKMGIEYNAHKRNEYAPQIKLSQTELHQSDDYFQSELQKQGMDYNKPMIVIHPGMTGHTLNWASRNYGRLIDRLENDNPGKYNFIISHTPSDEKYLFGLKDYLNSEEHSSLNDKVYFLDGSLRGLRNYMGILARAKAFIGPSTGTTHIANALGVPMVGLYSPIKVQSTLRWGPFKRQSDKVKVIVPDVVCGETIHCAGSICPYYECMAKVEVEDVFMAVKELLDNNSKEQ
ncbi:MAG: lipopolysaccharide heptosyltransferase family protein [Deltaproteobacteria bacterium]|nr:MAG: lipopolysaccharide heptosyltransferase family protein [Deltaproteobacteria bacterium]